MSTSIDIKCCWNRIWSSKQCGHLISTAWIYFGFHFLDNVRRTSELVLQLRCIQYVRAKSPPRCILRKAEIFEVHSALLIFIGSLKYGLISNHPLSSVQPMSRSSAVPLIIWKTASLLFSAQSLAQERQSHFQIQSKAWTLMRSPTM